YAEVIALAALVVSFVTGRAARAYAGRISRDSRTRSAAGMALTPGMDWAQGAFALLAELAVYAGIGGGASTSAGGASGLTGPLGPLLRGTPLATVGGAGPGGVWWLAITAAIVLAVREMANVCLAAAKVRTAVVGGPEAARRILVPAPPSGIRLVLLCVAVMIAGARPALGLAIVLGALALLLRAAVPGPNSGIIGYRGDGPLSVWIGAFVDGRLPPTPPLLVGLLVTGVLTAFGLGHLTGFLIFTPALGMLLGALGCWHPHDGRREWLVPALLHVGEYVILAAIGFSGRVWPPVIFALITAVALRHFDLAYRARNQVSPSLFMRPGANVGRAPALPGADWRGLGWDGRTLAAACVAAAGIASYAYAAAAVYLWVLLGREAVSGWSAGRSR
ncbi:MAG: hypothetical protein J2P26_10565, partial [Nocardiopsaceae bacterium]|nr:hypothetical protein [Nocardiopsaceae bacterium]